MKIEIYPTLSILEMGQRDNQEDAIAQWDNRLFILCDGMGGHEKGEVASLTVCQSLVKWFQENVKDDSFTDDQLHAALEYAYTELDKYDDDSPRKMGTTLTLLYIHNQGVTAAHMGDSRIYHIRSNSSPIGGGREGAVFYQSRDHSLVFDLFQAGEITYEEMATFPQKNVITRVMMPGQENRMRPDIVHITTSIHRNDWFVLCSDGMLEQMSNDELVTLLSTDKSDEEKRQRLIAATADNQDNHSAWIIHVKDVILEEGDEQLVNEEPTARCNAINILPKRNIDKNDVESVENVIERAEVVVDIVDEVAQDVDDDVVVVSTPAISKKKKKMKPSIKWVFAAILFVILVAARFVIFGNDEKENDEKDQIEQMKSSYNDEILRDSIKDSNRDINNGSARY